VGAAGFSPFRREETLTAKWGAGRIAWSAAANDWNDTLTATFFGPKAAERRRRSVHTERIVDSSLRHPTPKGEEPREDIARVVDGSASWGARTERREIARAEAVRSSSLSPAPRQGRAASRRQCQGSTSATGMCSFPS